MEGFEAGINYLLLPGVSAADEQGLRQTRIIISNGFFAPRPIIVDGLLETFQEPLGQGFACLVRQPITAEPLRIFVDAEQRKSPRARGGELDRGGQRAIEKLAGQGLESVSARAANARPQRPKGAAIGIFGPFLFQPAPLEAHKIPKPLRLFIKGIVKERQIGRCQPAHLIGSFSQLFQQNTQNEGARIVIGAVTLGEIWHGEGGVLKKSG